MEETAPGLGWNATSGFHDIFCDEYHGLPGTLAQNVATSKAARLAIAIGLDDEDVSDKKGRHDVAETLNEFLMNASTDALERALEIVGEDAERLCDPFAVRALLSRGINPVALLAFERAMGDADTLTEHNVYDDEGLRNHLCVVPENGPRRGVDHDYATCQLAPSTWWTCDEVSVPKGSIPETLMHAVEGLPVGHVISHPLVDPSLVIASVEECTMIKLRLKPATTPRTWREVVQEVIDERSD